MFLAGHSGRGHIRRAPIWPGGQGDHASGADRHFGALIFPWHDDDPVVCRKSALAAGEWHVCDLWRG